MVLATAFAWGNAASIGVSTALAFMFGALAAGLADTLFWWSLLVSLVIAFALTVPVNRALIARGRGHAVMQEFHAH
jgi:hypothetical protein